jgi:hypothetical protein
MPETAVHKNDLPLLPKNQIRTSRQILSMKSISVSKGKDEPANEQLRARILRSDSRHDNRSFCWRKTIHWPDTPYAPAKQPPLIRMIFFRCVAYNLWQGTVLSALGILKRIAGNLAGVRSYF